MSSKTTRAGAGSGEVPGRSALLRLPAVWLGVALYFSVLVSPWARTDRHTAALAGTGGSVPGLPKLICSPAQGRGFFGADAGGQAQGM
jgi:hypothetical protein